MPCAAAGRATAIPDPVPGRGIRGRPARSPPPRREGARRCPLQEVRTAPPPQRGASIITGGHGRRAVSPGQMVSNPGCFMDILGRSDGVWPPGACRRHTLPAYAGDDVKGPVTGKWEGARCRELLLHDADHRGRRGRVGYVYHLHDADADYHRVDAVRDGDHLYVQRAV